MGGLQPSPENLLLKYPHAPNLIEVDPRHRSKLQAPALAVEIVIIVAIAAHVPRVKRRQDGEHVVPQEGITAATAPGGGLLLALCLLGLLVLLGGVGGPDDALDAVVVVDGDPLQLHLRVVGEVVDEEALSLAHDPYAGVVVSELDDVESPEVG